MAKRTKGAEIITQIITEHKDRTRAEIQKWRKAIAMATDPETPRPYALQDMYDNLSDDGHFIAQVNLRKAATTGYGFSIVDKKTGEINAEKTDLFVDEWFYSLVDEGLNSITKGYTVLELLDKVTMEFALLPRRNVVGAKHTVLFEAAGDKGIDISQGYENTLLHFGRNTDIGVMANLCGQLIWKRNAQQMWADYTERFGMPLISATTNKTSRADIAAINKMLQELGQSATAVLPEGTTIHIDPFTGGDAFRIYLEQINCINDEIAKPIVGGTMITSDGSSRSQSEVHERNLDDKIAETDRRMIAFVVNNQLLPLMQTNGWNVNPETDRFTWDTSFELSLDAHWNIVNQAMLQGYEVETEWLSKTFNIPIVGRREPVQIEPAADDDKTKATAGSIAADFR